jgi:hypothetical protein
MTQVGSAKVARTDVVFCAVTPTIAVMPWHPAAANALRSACIPAPPPESDVAMERQRGGVTAPS